MPVRLRLSFLALLLASIRASGAAFDPEAGLPLMQRFLPESYQGHYQVNDLAIGADGRFYGTTQRAVIRYDGVRWERLPFPALWAWRLVATPDGRVYVSGDDEVGYFADDPAGRAVYHSLAGQVPAAALPIGGARGAKAAGGAVAFAIEKGWLVWQGERMHFTAAPAAGRTQIHSAGDRLFASGPGVGLRRWDGTAWQPFADATAIKGAGITGLTTLPDGRLLALASPYDLLAVTADGAAAGKWAEPAAAPLAAQRPLGVRALSGGRIAAFTRQLGVVITDSDRTAITRVDKALGLASNTAYGLIEDRDGGLWVGGTNGVTRLDLATPVTIFDERNGPGAGGMRAFARQDRTFYSSVVDAVYHLVPADPVTGAAARFERIPGPPATGVVPIINDIASHPEGLLVAALGQLQLYRPGTGFKSLLQRRDDISIVYTTPADPARVFLAADKSVLIGRIDAGGFTSEHEAATGAPELITPVGADTIWVGTRARGFFRLRASGADGWRTPVVEEFGRNEGLPATRGYTAVFRLPWGVGFFTDEGTWRFDDAQRRFLPEAAFQFADGGRHGFPSTLDRANRLWASGGRVDGRGGRPLGWYELPAGAATGPAAWRAAPPTLQPFAGAVGFLNFARDISPAGTDIVWGKSPQALLRIDTARLARQPAAPWRPRLHSITAAGAAQPLTPSARPRYAASAEHTVFRFSPGRFDGGAITYRTRLLGHDARWSAPSAHPEISFTNLEGGPFTLEVIATDGAGRDSEPLRFAFSVAPPWHRTTWARVAWALLALGAVVGFVRWRLGRAERERVRLEGIVAERTRDLAAARDAAEAASRAKSAFLASMSHELRTPLNGVIGYAQLLSGDARLAADQRERVRIVHQSGEHLLRMINDVLDLAKIEAGKIELRPAPFALGELLADVCAAHQNAAAAKRLAFRTELAPDLPAWVEGDAQKLRQILDNLIGNAVKFTTSGDVMLRVQAGDGRPESGAGNDDPANDPAAPSSRLPSPASRLLTFSVSDTGPGIAPADQARLFQPFEQARTARPNAPGTGLGLAISRALVERMGGALALASEAGRGSTFTFSIALPVLDEAAIKPAAPAVSGYEGPRRRVLIVDDHAVNRSLLADLLAPLGFACDEADSGERALALLARQADAWPDLVIVDLRMEGMDGLELTRRLRALPRGAALRVLLTSASVISFDAAEARAAGCDDFLPKPFRTDDLIGKLGALLALRWVQSARSSSRDPFARTAPLPEAARARLRDALAQGDLHAFRATLAQVRHEHPDARANWDELDEAAAGFQLSRLRALLETK